MIDLLISGGQSGADLGGLRAAAALGISTGGYMPKGFRTEDGPRPEIASLYGLMEHESRDYEDRTLANVRMADGTVIFGRRSQGSNLTENRCWQLKKPCAWVIWIPEPTISFSSVIDTNGTHLMTPNGRAVFRLWLRNHGIKTLNVAGNRESKNPGIGQFTEAFLKEALK